jgi:fructose-1-phosphate kinase PfkB-like protein
MRAAVLGAALLFIVVLLALTVHAAAGGGIDVLTVLSAFVLVLFALGIVGALLHPPPE